MKINKLTIFLIIIIIGLVSFIIYDKVNESKNYQNSNKEENISIIDSISLDYVTIYLLSDGSSYIAPISEEEINELNISNNLKDRLNTLYLRAFYQDIYINNYKLKAFIVNLDDKIRSISKIELDKNTYIAFIKENNTVAIFNYMEYYDLLYTDVVDNYNNLENVLNIENNQIIYLNGSKKDFQIKE